MQKIKMIKLKFDKPVYTQCRNCFKLYNMVEFGVDCPICKKKEIKTSKEKTK
ncbi:MAG: hypothetical protein QXW97_01695 [Candidatus Pacearchaeota archaeon]